MRLAHGYQIVCLWDLMKRLDPKFVLQLMNWFSFARIVEFEPSVLKYLALTGAQLPDEAQLFPADLVDKAGLQRVADKFEENGFVYSAGVLRDIAETYSPDPRARLSEVATAVRVELKSTLIMQIPPDKAKYYKSPRLFGEKVAEAFPSALVDIEEAGNCYAAGRNIACVMHLQRVLEVSLRALGQALNLDIEHLPSWDSMLTKIDGELQKRYKDKPPGWAADEQFYAEAAAFLREVKDAWRNPTMHVENKYDEEKAQEILDSVKKFMRHLSTKVREPLKADDHSPART